MDSESVVQAKGTGFPGPNYQLLEAYLGMPLVAHKDLARLIRIAIQSKASPTELPDICCVIFEVDQNSNTASRAATLVLHTRRARRAQRRLAHLTEHKANLIGVYPTLDNPVAIFELETPAADYVQRNVLPSFGSSLSASIKRLLAVLTRTDPGLSGIGLVIRFR